MIMFISALICGLKGCGGWSAGRTSVGAGSATVACGWMPIAAIPTTAAAAINEMTDFCMDVSLPFDLNLALEPRAWTSRCRLHPHGPDDSAAEHQNNKPIAAVDEEQLWAAHGEAIVDQHGGEHKTAPAEQAR